MLDERANFLRYQTRNITSQFGEDGLLAALFERIGTANRWCFEVGANDGTYLSNTWILRENGWRAVLIEADKDLHRDCTELYATELVHCVHERVDSHNLDEILTRHGAPPDLDLGVIDVDGPDLEVWQGMTRFRPRVMLVEFNASGGGPLTDGKYQAGFDEVVAAGRAKGYLPLVRIGVNVLFLEGECLPFLLPDRQG